MESRRGERRQAWPEPEGERRRGEVEQNKAWQEEHLSLHLEELQADKENQAGRPKKVINSVKPVMMLLINRYLNQCSGPVTF